MGSHIQFQDQHGISAGKFRILCMVLFFAACAFLMAASSCDDSKGVSTADSVTVIHVYPDRDSIEAMNYNYTP